MAADANPILSAGATLEYSTNSGGAWTPFGAEVLDVEGSGRKRKRIERKLLGGTRVQKLAARVDHGEVKVTLEYSSATWAITNGWFDSNTYIWLRNTKDDSGGTNGSRHVWKGYVADHDVAPSKGDDEVEQYSILLIADDYAFTAGA